MIDTVIFDLGGVLIDWDPKSIYREFFDDESELEYFFDHVCTSEWNEKQDEGRTLKEATESKVKEFPSFEEPIRMYYDRWKEMIRGEIDGTVKILERLHIRKEYRLLALTNWSEETFPYAVETFDFLSCFEGILVSGEEKMAKPDPKIYKLLLDRFEVKASKSIFIDDRESNVVGARKEGIHAIQFKNPEKLKEDLKNYGIKH